VKVATIFASPFIRAQETADAIQAAFPSSKVIAERKMASGAKADAYKSILLTTTEKPPFLFIGHNPDISIFSSRCTGVVELMDDASMDTGEMTAIETGPLEQDWMRGELLWRRLIQEWKTQS
jgi:phosphohistidine phosphatase SixA